jgi:hypothetical protein
VTTTPEEPLRDEDLQSTDIVQDTITDADGTDGLDADGTDGTDADGTDGDATDTVDGDSQDADGTDS